MAVKHGCGGLPADPLVAEVVDDYLRHAASVAATRGSRFLEAVAFAQHTFGVDLKAAFAAMGEAVRDRSEVLWSERRRAPI